MDLCAEGVLACNDEPDDSRSRSVYRVARAIVSNVPLVLRPLKKIDISRLTELGIAYVNLLHPRHIYDAAAARKH